VDESGSSESDLLFGYTDSSATTENLITLGNSETWIHGFKAYYGTFSSGFLVDLLFFTATVDPARPVQEPEATFAFTCLDSKSINMFS
jgi:hypothetical protein